MARFYINILIKKAGRFIDKESIWKEKEKMKSAAKEQAILGSLAISRH